MLKTRGFVAKRRRGAGVVMHVREHYLRDDIYCSSKACTVCQHMEPVLDAEPAILEGFGPHYLVLDTNMLVHHMDFFENSATKNVIIPQTVMEEVNHVNSAIHNRVRAVISNPDRQFYVFCNEHHRETHVEAREGETPNDRNDRAVRMVTQWYSKHLSSKQISVILLTDDAGNRQHARNEGITAMPVSQYAEKFTSAPELLDLVCKAGSTVDEATGANSFEYEEHLSKSAVADGIRCKLMIQGTLQIAPYNPQEGYIILDSSQNEGHPLLGSGCGNQVYLKGRAALNRAIHGDVVAVAVLPHEEWLRPEDQTISTKDTGSDDEDDDNKEKESSADETEGTKRRREDSSCTVPNTSKNLPTGKVVAIIRRNWRPLCGSVKPTPAVANSATASRSSGGAMQSVLFFPVDRRMPCTRIFTRQLGELIGKRIVVTIDDWPRKSKYPIGHYTRTLGDMFDRETETEVILVEHGVEYREFSRAVLRDLPIQGADYEASEEEIAKRRDLRHLDVCSIDPPGCTDIDDALHARMLPNGNVEVGVHIADVTHFVKPNTAIDAEAASRGTTVYLVDKRIDMLPELLGSNLCSLRSNVDRLAFSVIWELDPKTAGIINVEFTKSIIRSRASLTYEEAQMRLEDGSQNDSVTKSIRQLNTLAKILRQQRRERGALELASPEIRFKLTDGDQHDPIDVELKQLRDTNSLVEEFMLLANITVATRIFATYPNTSLLRRHPSPQAEAFVSLNFALAAVLGEDAVLKVETSKELAESLDRLVVPSQPYFNTLLRIMTTRCMMQAVYFCTGLVPEADFVHYGLATEKYTHFTSPIRRYSDVVVHRLLAAAISSGGSGAPELYNKQQLANLCDNLNYRHRMAQYASRSSVELYTSVFFFGMAAQQQKDASSTLATSAERSLIVVETVDAYVSRVLRNGISALIPAYGLEASVKTYPSQWEYDPTDGGALVQTTQRQRLTVFSPVRLRIIVEEDRQRGAGTRRVLYELAEETASTA